jgi:hypothetical protein
MRRIIKELKNVQMLRVQSVLHSMDEAVGMFWVSTQCKEAKIVVSTKRSQAERKTIKSANLQTLQQSSGVIFFTLLLHNRVNLIIRDIFPPLSTICTKARFDGLSLSTVFMATWARVQAHYTANSSVTFGMMLASRTQDFGLGIGADEMALPCLNALPQYIEDASRSVTVQEIGAWLIREEKRRDQVMERSRLSDICAWVGTSVVFLRFYLHIISMGARLTGTMSHHI